MHFLREEFQPVAQSPVLHQLDKMHLTEVLKSPFLQASELEVLHAVLKWGEHELVRRMEDRGKLDGFISSGYLFTCLEIYLLVNVDQ